MDYRDKQSLDQIRDFLELKISKEPISKLEVEKPDGYELDEGIRSRERVIDLAEVFTPNWLVDEMVNDIPLEYLKIDNRVLEPSCGNGNFLVEIMARKLQQITLGSSAEEMNYQVLICLTSTYGIDISESNVLETRLRLFELIQSFVFKYVGPNIDSKFVAIVHYVLEKNIIYADFLKNNDSIEIHEFTFPKKFYISQRIFTLLELLEINSEANVFPRPEKILETKHYLELI